MKIQTATIIGSAAILATSCGIKSGKDAVEKVANVTYYTINEEYIDKSVKPKDDFYEFATGTWRKNNPVPNSESRWGSFNELDESNKAKLLDILKNAAANNSEKGSQNQILGDYFTSYTDIEYRNKVGIAPIQAELNRISRISSNKEIPEIIGEMHTNGVRSLFGFGVGQDLKNVDRHIAGFRQGGIGLPNKDYYTSKDKASILAAYGEHIQQTFVLMGMNPDEASKKSSLVVEFEKSLAESMMAPAELRIPEKTYNKMSLKETKAMFGEFEFEKYLAATGSQYFDSLIVGQPDFVEKVAQLTNERNLEEWKTYLTWCTINHYSGHLSQEFIDLNFNFYGGVLSGKKEMKPIEDRVIDEITRMNFGEWLGRAFVEKHFSENASKRVNQMVDNLLAVYKERINGLTWMTQETKVEALKKLNAIGRKLGYPSKWEDYSSLAFNDLDYVGNYRKAMQFGHKKNMMELSEAVDKEEWGMPAHMVNAYYHPLLNEIAFPAGIMQAPFFDENAEDAVNYGSIGMVIGHEFTHGFDDMGSKFAADGSFTNWWSEEDRKAFEVKTSLLGETYSAFCPIEGHCVNPNLTMGENIADLGGLTMAYYAYTRTAEFKTGIKRNGFSPAQRFFIAYAQLWKINYTDEELKNRIANDPHSPGMYRVNGPLKNCPEFFEAFDIKEGDKMRNAKKKMAVIW